MSDNLHLSCDSVTDDELVADTVHIQKAELCRVRIGTKVLAGDESARSVWLREDKARELFNWLGVWLHGGNRP